MRPLDPRLLKEARPARRYLVTATGLGVLTAALVLVQATVLAHVITHAGAGVDALRPSLVTLMAVIVLRALTVYGGEVAALRAAAQVTSQLRRRVVRHALALGPQWLGQRSPGQLTTLVTRGLDALEPYFARYLPQLVLACVVPLAVLVRVAGADLLSAIVIGVTLPCIPVFLALVGMHTRARTERQWALLSALGGHFLDVVQGLPTLKLFGRAKAQTAIIERVTDEHRRATMATLRIAFLSALVLELVATLSVALVAVEVGLRLLAGALPYETALMVLLLAPEAYLPLRAVGAQFHASMEGAVAASAALDILDEALLERPVQREVRARSVIRLEGVSYRHPGRDVAQLVCVDLTLSPGTTTAVVGASGAGKSTVLDLLLGLLAPDAGRITVGGVDLQEADLRDWCRQVAWVPQSPQLFTGTLADNVRLGLSDATDEQVAHALELAGAAFVHALPLGLHTAVGERGLTLSSGQRQRVALARAFLRDAPVLLLDEPGAHLDLGSDQDLREIVARLSRGRTVVLVTHSAAWTATADVVLHLTDGRLQPRTVEVAA